MAMIERPAAVADHPLAPLTLEEIQAAVRIVREERGLGPKHRFAGLTLKEPPKEQVLSYQPGDTFEREALAVILDGNEGTTYEAVVSLSQGTVASWTHIPDSQPPIVLEEFDECEAAPSAVTLSAGPCRARSLYRRWRMRAEPQTPSYPQAPVCLFWRLAPGPLAGAFSPSSAREPTRVRHQMDQRKR